MKKVKAVRIEGAEGEELDLELQQSGGAPDDEQEGLGEEEEAEDEAEALGDSESDADDSAEAEPEEEEALDLDWSGAREQLKNADANCSHSIDDFDKRADINSIKARYNAKERTRSLFDAIKQLPFSEG